MELIHADGDMKELRFIDSFTKFDASISLEESTDDNSWMLSMSVECYTSFPIDIGDYVYIEGTEWGGQAEEIRHNSSNRTVEIYGLCWRGLLLRRVIVPNEGETHLSIAADDANDALRELMGSKMSNIFSVSDSECPVSYSHSFRYVTLLGGIEDSLEEVDCRLEITFSDGSAVLEAKPVTDYSEILEFSQDVDGSMIAELGSVGCCNHILALGSGEMLERQVAELWRLSDGSITDDGDSDGIPDENDLRTYLYDYPSAESLDSLVSYAKKKLREYSAESSMEFTLEAEDIDMALGDIVGARDSVTGLSQKLRVSEKLLTIDSGGVSLKHTMETI